MAPRAVCTHPIADPAARLRPAVPGIGLALCCPNHDGLQLPGSSGGNRGRWRRRPPARRPGVRRVAHLRHGNAVRGRNAIRRPDHRLPGVRDLRARADWRCRAFERPDIPAGGSRQNIRDRPGGSRVIHDDASRRNRLRPAAQLTGGFSARHLTRHRTRADGRAHVDPRSDEGQFGDARKPAFVLAVGDRAGRVPPGLPHSWERSLHDQPRRRGLRRQRRGRSLARPGLRGHGRFVFRPGHRGLLRGRCHGDRSRGGLHQHEEIRPSRQGRHRRLDLLGGGEPQCRTCFDKHSPSPPAAPRRSGQCTQPVTPNLPR